MNPLVVEGKHVYVWPSALTEAECAEVAARAPWTTAGPGRENGYRVTDLPFAQWLAALCETRMPGAPPLEWVLDLVTLGKSDTPMHWHFDAVKPPSRWKLCLYLDDLPESGTVFSRTERVQPRTPRGTIVLFDIRLEHCSAALPAGATKRVVGLRAL